MQKRGMGLEVLKAIIGGLLALIVIAGLTFFAMKFLGLLGKSPDKAEISAKQNAEALAGKINALVGGVKPVDYTTMLFSLVDDYAVVGFSKEEKIDGEDLFSFVYDFCGDDDKIDKVEKPQVKECSGACLCLYTRVSKNFREDAQLKQCYELKGTDLVLGNAKILGQNASVTENMGGKEYALDRLSPYLYSKTNLGYFFIYGDCGKTSFGTQELYLEKVKDPETGLVYVYITHNKVVGSPREGRIKSLVGKIIDRAIRDSDETEFKFLILNYKDLLGQDEIETDAEGFLSKLTGKAINFSENKKFNESLGIYSNVLSMASWPEIKNQNTLLNYGCRPKLEMARIYVNISDNAKAAEFYTDYIACETNASLREKAVKESEK